MHVNGDTPTMAAVYGAVMGFARFRVRLLRDDGAGHRFGQVLDDSGAEIGTASDYIYGGRGFAVQTRPFGGFVPEDQIEFVS